MLVTTELLKKMEACSDQVKLFKKLYPQGIDIPEDLIEAQKIYDEAGKAGLDIEWWLRGMKLTGVERRWHFNGKLKRETHYQNGKRQNPKNKIAAARFWYSDGRLECEHHYQKDKHQDLKDGTAAVKYWNPDGKLTYEAHYRSGAIQ